MNPLFSVIIPVYNVAAELERAVRSVQTQDFSEWEIVLVDDGSTDGSGELCDRLAERDSRIKVLHQKNEGVVITRKNGFATSSGEWILFLDGDDEQTQGLLSALAAIIAKSNPDIIRFAFVMGSQGDSFKNHIPGFDEGLYSVEDLVRQAKKTPLEATEMCLWDKVYRRTVCREAFIDVGNVRIKHSEDGLFAFAAFLRSRTFFVSHRVGVQYWLRNGSAVHRLNPEIVMEKRIFIDKICSLFGMSPYRREDLVGSMKAYHSYEAISLIYSYALRWKATALEVYPIIRDLRKHNLLKDASLELVNARRKAMCFLLLLPCAFLLYRIVFRMKRRCICE